MITLNGSDALAYNDLGVVVLKKGRHEEAIGCFTKAIELKNGVYAQAWNNLGIARGFYGDTPAAVDALIQV